MIWRPPRSTPFPYTTLFRSSSVGKARSTSDSFLIAMPGHYPTREFGVKYGIIAVKLDPRLRHPGRAPRAGGSADRERRGRSEEHTSELQSQSNLVCRLLLEK